MSEPAQDPRHQRRITIMQDVFACTFTDATIQNCLTEEADSPVGSILQQLSELDSQIQAVAPERPLNQINKVDLSILRTILFEAKTKNTPKKVLINEAVELAKAFGSDSSPRFVNGVLAKLLLEPEPEVA